MLKVLNCGRSFMCFLILLEIWTYAADVGTTVVAYTSETLLLWAKSQLQNHVLKSWSCLPIVSLVNYKCIHS